MAFTAEQKRAYYAAHPELKRRYYRERRERHPDYQGSWHATHRDQINKYETRRRRLKKIEAVKRALLELHYQRLDGVVVGSAAQIDSWAIEAITPTL